MNDTLLAIFGLPGGSEWIVILVIALLIFGKRLPEVGRGLGKSIVEFKKGLKGVNDEVGDVERDIDDAVEEAEKKAANKRLERKSATTTVGERDREKVAEREEENV